VSETSRPFTLREALLNQYQAILVAGAAGFCLVAGDVWPALVLLGFDCVALALVVGNQKIGRLRYLKSLSKESTAPATPGTSFGSVWNLSPERRRVYEEMNELTRAVEAGYARLSEVSRPLVAEQRSKLQTILGTTLSRLSALQAYDDLSKKDDAAGRLASEIAALEAKVADGSTAGGLREKYRDTLAAKRRLQESFARSAENRAVLETELDTLGTALRILAQESTALQLPSQVSQRLDEILSSAESTNRTVRELEELSNETGELRRAREASALRNAG